MSKQNVEKMVEMARAHVEAGGIRAAEVYYRMILKATESPTRAVDRLAGGEACAFFAARAVAKGGHGEACDWYQKAIFADPLFVDYRINFIVKALLPMGMFKNAWIEADRVTRLEPENPDGWRSLAICCAALGDEEAAAAAYDRQVELDPENPLAAIDRATLAINVGDYDTARAMAASAIESEHKGEAFHMLGLISYRESLHEEAVGYYDRALAFGVQDEEQVRWNKSLALHAIGRYREGFALAEARGRQMADPAMRLVMNRFAQPALTREDLRGPPLRVHVHQEMGNGDAIAMARYLDLLADLGHEVTLETMDSMVELHQRSFPYVKVIGRAIDYPGAIGVPPFDRHVTTLSLPYLFETEVDSVPWRGPYIKESTPKRIEFAKQLPRGRRIGLCWSSGIRDGLWISRYGRAKSMRFDEVGPEIVDYPPGAQIVSLQVGPEREQGRGFGWVDDVLPENPSWDDTAALVACLDAVVTVDTAIAHLAGAMGKPTFLMMQRDGATWHFMCERPGAPWNERSPWYPSVRIFRQTTPGSWYDVVERVRSALDESGNGSGDNPSRPERATGEDAPSDASARMADAVAGPAEE